MHVLLGLGVGETGVALLCGWLWLLGVRERREGGANENRVFV